MRQYGVAWETARKAVRALVAEGLVYVVQGRGVYVAARD
jgi:DNA-binding GntR family transcriptional regulator